MNNSLIASKNISLEMESQVDRLPSLRQRETQVKEILEATKNIVQSRYWKILDERVFKPQRDKLKKDLQQEDEPIKMYRLQGQVRELEKLVNLPNEVQTYLKELDSISFQIKEIQDNENS